MYPNITNSPARTRFPRINISCLFLLAMFLNVVNILISMDEDLQTYVSIPIYIFILAVNNVISVIWVGLVITVIAYNILICLRQV